MVPASSNINSKRISFSSDQVGNSDDDLSDSDNESYFFNVLVPVNVKRTTIITQDGEKIKGGEYIRISHQIVRKALNDYIAQINEVKNEIHIGRDWFYCAGRLSKFQCNSEIKILRVKPSEKLKNFCVGPSKIKLRYDDETERLHLPSDFVQCCGYVIKEKDPSYSEINAINRAILSKLNISDAELASIQLKRLCDENVGIQNDENVNEWLDFLNALIVGVEGSRINNTFVTALMTLELIKASKMTYEDAFFKDQYGGQFPMATLKSGSGNFIKRQNILDANITRNSLKDERKNPQWLGCTLKEAIIIKKWLMLDTTYNNNVPVSKLKQNIKTRIIGLLSTYYGVNNALFNEDVDDDVNDVANQFAGMNIKNSENYLF